MKKITFICLMAAWTLLAGNSFAQMSTFPAPPPLASASKPSSDPAKSPSNVSVTPDFGISAPGGNNSSPSPTATQDTSAANAADSTPETAAMLSSMEALDDKITLEKGDRISFRVIEDKDLAVPRVVTDTGEVDFPYIGRVKVEGQTCHQVALELKKLLEVDYYKRATVIVGLDVIADRDKDTVKTHDLAWVVGQVHQVGPQEITKSQPMTVSQIILRAGGFGDFADQRKVRVIHRSALSAVPSADETPDENNTKDGEIVDVKAVFDGLSSNDPVVEPNDYIIVPKRLVNF
jgi:polysaccharide export outer membrane protein